MKDFAAVLLEELPETDIRQSEDMKKHTTFRVGGAADFYVNVRSEEDLKKGIACCRRYDMPVYVLGNGSNVLISDKGLHGVVFQLDHDFSKVEMEQKKDGTIYVTAQAGALLSKLGSLMLEEELTGFEWAAGIPGTIGGAVYMNAGAYGGEMKDIVCSVRILTKDLQIETRVLSQLSLGYRHSALMDEEAYILSVTFALQRGDRKLIATRMEELANKRREKQPLEYPSAGSTFKRPEGYFAGKLIEDAGLKGYQVGGAQISEKHCGFVINRGGATAQQIYQLTEDVKRIIREQFGVEMEREIALLGEF